MEIKDLKVGQIVDILYRTEMNCTPKPRMLTNLKVLEILPGSFKFIQHGKKDKNFWINKEDIKFVRVVK